MQMHTLRVNVKGITPLLMANPGGMRSKGGTVTVGKKVIPTPEEEAENLAYRTDDGDLYIPTIAFRASMLRASVGEKIDKRAAKATLSGSVFVLEEQARLFHPDTGEVLTEYVIDQRRVVVQRAGIVRSRPRLNEWATTFELDCDLDVLGEGTAAEILTRYLSVAGSTVGVGDYRPEKTGMFGRYTVEVVDAS